MVTGLTKLKKVEVFFLVVILVVFFIVVGKYFFPHLIEPKFFFDFLKMQARYVQYEYGFNKKNIFITSNFTSSIADSVPVLLYHGIVEESDGKNVLRRNFEDQLFTLKKAGWETISLEYFLDFLHGKKKLPSKSFLLTFDDGRKDSYYPADPLLRSLNYTAVMFIDTKHSIALGGNDYYLSPRELKIMLKSKRWELQSHSRTAHSIYPINKEGERGTFIGNKLWLQEQERIETDEEFKLRVEADLSGSKNDIWEAFGVKPRAFAYPFGDYGHISKNYPEADETVLGISSAIFSVSFYQYRIGSYNTNYSSGDRQISFAKRISVNPNWNGEDLLIALSNTERKQPSSQTDSIARGWIKIWGSSELTGKSLLNQSLTSPRGSFFLLEGSGSWRDYTYQLQMDKASSRGTVVMYARYQDLENNVACSFNDKGLKIEQYLNGKKRVMAEKDTFFEMPKENLQLGVMVNKDKVECLVNGNSAIYSYYLSPELLNGGIGFKTWDPQTDNSELTIKSVSVEEIR